MSCGGSPFRRILSLLLAVGILLSATQGHAQRGHCQEKQRNCPEKSTCSTASEQGAPRSSEIPPDEGSDGGDSRRHCGGAHCHVHLGIPSAVKASTPLPSEEFVPLPASFLERLVLSEIFRPPLA